MTVDEILLKIAAINYKELEIERMIDPKKVEEYYPEDPFEGLTDEQIQAILEEEEKFYESLQLGEDGTPSSQVPEETLRDNWGRIPDDFDEILTYVRKHFNETFLTPYNFDDEDVDSKSFEPTSSNHPCPPRSVQGPTKPQSKP